jgi:hypothetical protein
MCTRLHRVICLNQATAPQHNRLSCCLTRLALRPSPLRHRLPRPSLPFTLPLAPNPRFCVPKRRVPALSLRRAVAQAIQKKAKEVGAVAMLAPLPPAQDARPHTLLRPNVLTATACSRRRRFAHARARARVRVRDFAHPSTPIAARALDLIHHHPSARCVGQSLARALPLHHRMATRVRVPLRLCARFHVCRRFTFIRSRLSRQ